ncbi:MAG: nucleoside hydrolase [Clostridia bacterium]|nr:nucleoside hydrolase [Clostridia bacterium]
MAINKGFVPKNVIIDTDMGWDDILSILLLMKDPNVNIIGITVTGCGETHLADGVSIAQSLLKMGNINAPVCAGAASPSEYNHCFPQSFRETMDDVCGLRNILPVVTEPADPRTAWEFIKDALEDEENQTTILSLGGLTNIAKALDLKPKLENIERIVIMGGAIYVDGNVAALNNSQPDWNQGPVYSTNIYAEWNIFLDAAAAKKVLAMPVPITMVPLDACDYVLLEEKYSDLITATDPVAQLAKELIVQKAVGPAKESIPLPIFDPLASLIMAGNLRHTREVSLRVDVVTTDSAVDNNCGQTISTRDENIRTIDVVTGVSNIEFQNAFTNIINLPLNPVPGSIIHKNVGILLFDQIEIQDFAGAFEVLGAARNSDNTAVFNVFTVGQDDSPKKSNAGVPPQNGVQSYINLTPDYTFSNHPAIDILVVVGGQGIDSLVALQEKDPAITNWIQSVSKTAAYVAGICSGVLLLAKAKVLNSLKVTTHHTRFQQLKKMSDDEGLDLTVLDTRNADNYIHQPISKFMTSGGVHCGIALAVHIVELIMGEDASCTLASDVLEYTIPTGIAQVPQGFPAPTAMDPTNFVLGFSHINVIVADMEMMEQATEFYSRVLGFQQAWSLWLPEETCKHFGHDAGFPDGTECKVMVRFLIHPNAQLHLELMLYEEPKGDQTIHYHKTNDVGGIRHVALEVADAEAAYEWLKNQEGVQIIMPLTKGYWNPEKLSPDPQTFFYWLDPYGVQWEFEQGRPMSRVINGIVG